jgi:hypothetical protein
MSTEDHPLIKMARQYEPDLQDAGRDQLLERMSLEMVAYNPQQRVAVIDQIEKQLLDDEGSLRERAQLLTLRRALSDTHQKMLQAKR